MIPAPEAGMTLIETMISSLVFAVVISMVLVTMGTLDSTTTQAVQTSQEAELAQSAASYLDEYLSAVVPPMVAAVAAGNTSAESSVALGPGAPCWGASQPASGSLAQSVAEPSRMAITVAHDYDLVFCGEKPGTATPQVYEITLAGCTSATYGNCTLQIVDYGTSCEPGIATPSGSGCSSPGAVVASVPNIWCDSYCQGATGAGQNPAGTTIPRACWDVPGNSVSGCSAHTPPLFEYFGRTGQYGMSQTQDSASINYEIENADSTTGQLASDTGCSSVSGLYIDLAANVSGCDDAATDLGSIQMVVFNITILDTNGLPVSTTTSKIGSEVDDQVLLGNELATSATCGTAIVESPAQPQAFFPLYDTGVPLDDLGDISDLQSGTSMGVEFDQTPGPLPCDPALGSMYFPNSSSTQTSYAYSPAFNSGFGQFGDLRGLVLATDRFVQSDMRVQLRHRVRWRRCGDDRVRRSRAGDRTELGRGRHRRQRSDILDQLDGGRGRRRRLQLLRLLRTVVELLVLRRRALSRRPEAVPLRAPRSRPICADRR